LNFKAKGSENRIIQISLKNIGSIDIVVCTVLGGNR
jgi:hypothetical protein